MENEISQPLQPTPRVSIVIPVRNGAQYLGSALHSIMFQDINEAVEVIVVNDGSTDRTGDVARAYDCTLIETEPRGAICARNTGLGVAKGTYVLFHDADDLLRPDALSTMLKEMTAGPSEVQVVLARRKDFLSPDMTAADAARRELREEAYHGALAGCALIRRDVFQITGLFDERLSYTGDALAWILRLQELQIPFRRIDYIATDRRIHNQNMGVTNKDAQYADYLAALRSRIVKRPIPEE